MIFVLMMNTTCIPALVHVEIGNEGQREGVNYKALLLKNRYSSSYVFRIPCSYINIDRNIERSRV